jgi:hypothetical protein
MSKIFVGQTKLKITLALAADITGYQTCEIRYTKPDGTRGSFTAVVEDENPGVISYDLSTNVLDIPGRWAFWARITYIDGRISIGKADYLTISPEGAINS